MANQPPKRHWFRSGSISRLALPPASIHSPAPAPAPAPATPPMIRPAFNRPLAPTAPTFYPKPAAHISTTQSAPPTSTASTREPSPTYSPTITRPAARTTPQSPKTKPTASPPSPLTLPPAQMKPNVDTVAEQKNLLIQKTFENPNKHTFMSREKKISDYEEMGTKVLTIAGENKGAFMELTQSPKKKEVGENSYSLLYNKAFKTGKKDESSSSSDDNEENNKSHKEEAKHGLPVPMSSAFMNSNIQGVNNSIMFNSSCTHHDPGVHLALLRKPAGGGFHVKDDHTGLHN